MRWPWISRRRHEREVHELGNAAAEVAVGLADERDELRARVGELEWAIREHLTTDAGHSRLRAVLEGDSGGAA